MGVRIVSDSTCDMPKELAEKLNIPIIPLSIVLGSEPFKDGKDITPSDIFEWVEKNNETPKTSAPTIEDASKVIKPILEAGDDIVYMGISGSMSTTINVLKIAAEELGCGDQMFAIDSKSLSTGISLLLLKAWKMADDGMPAAQIVEEMDKYIAASRTSFVLDNLLYLHKGGRCSAATTLFAGALSIKPMIVVKDGKMDADKKFRGKFESVIEKYYKELEPELLKADKDAVFVVSCAIDEKIVADIKDRITAMGRFDNVYEAVAGGVISSHCGPGTIGVMYIAGSEE